MKTTIQTQPQNYSLILINKFGEQTNLMDSENFDKLMFLAESFNDCLSPIEKEQFEMKYIVIMQF